MKRALILVSVGLVLLALAGPAGANTIPSIDIACDAVSFSWTGFPTHPVVLTVTVTQGDEVTVASFNTQGATAGDGSVPVSLDSGSASARLSWTLQKEHTVGPVTADLLCTTTTTSTTEPPITTSVPPPSTTVTTPPQCGPATLACTGSSSSPLVFAGFGAVGLGALLLAGARRRRA